MKKIFKNIVALFVGCLIAFVILEIALRVIQPFDFRVKGKQISLPANQKFEMENDFIKKLDDTIIHTRNSIGLRGEEPPKDFNDKLTIVTIGGSTTECFYLSDDETWTEKLGKLLKSKNENIWINNAGLEGHSTFGHQVLLDDYIVPLKPKMVLFLIGTNDVGTEGPGDFDKQNIQEIRFDGLGNFIKSLGHYSEVIGSAVNFYRYYLAYDQGLVHKEVELEKWEKLDTDQKVLETAKLNHKTKYISNYRTRVEKLVRSCIENEIRPVLITQPKLNGDAIDPTTGVDLSNLKYGELNGEMQWQILEMYNNVTREVAKTNDVLLIDLAILMPKDSRYYYDFMHYTNEGASKVAEIVNAELSSEIN